MATEQLHKRSISRLQIQGKKMENKTEPIKRNPSGLVAFVPKGFA